MANTFEGTLFLSHNSADKSAVETLTRLLESSRPAIRCWLDKDDLRSQGTWMQQIESVVGECEAAALFFGPHGMGPVQEGERQILLHRAMQTPEDFRLIPVLLPGAKKSDIQGFTTLHNWVDFSHGLDSPAALERFVAFVLGEAPRRIESGDEIPPNVQPYRGLERFDGRHADFFFGRDREIHELCNCVKAWPFVAVIGGSGSGKSSLVRAGLQSSLAYDDLPHLVNTAHVVVLPGSQPIRALADQLAAAAAADSAEAPEALSDVFEARFRERKDGLLSLLSSRFPGEDQTVLLLIDQFEEIFTHCQDGSTNAVHGRQQVERFVDLLAAVAESGHDRFRTIITLRADFFDRCLDFPHLVPLVQNHQVLVGEIPPKSMHDVIVNPAQRVGAYFEKGLVARILTDVDDQHGSLPLLQHALKELWGRRRGRWLTNEAYDASGGVSGALRKRADDTLRILSPGQQQIAKNIFLRLATLGEGVRDTRRRVRIQELYPADDGLRSEADDVIDVLRGKDARLIVTNDDGTAEVTHETLIQQWSTLKRWLNENRDEKRLVDRLRDAAHEWRETCPKNVDGRDATYLWEGGRLDDAEKLHHKRKDVLNALEREFVGASIARREAERAEETLRRERELRLAEEREAEARAREQDALLAASKQRRLSSIAWGAAAFVVVLFVVATFLAIVANNRTTEAKRTLARMAVDRARGFGGQGREERALLWFARGLTYADAAGDQQLANTIRTELNAWSRVNCRLKSMVPSPGRSHLMAVGPDGRTLLVAGFSKTARLWDAETGQQIGADLEHPEYVEHVAISPDGKTAVTRTNSEAPLSGSHGSHNSKVFLWDAKSGAAIKVLNHRETILRTVYHPDGHLIATASKDRTVCLWSAASGERIARMEHSGPVSTLAFSPDGSIIASGADDGIRLWRTNDQALLFGPERPTNDDQSATTLAFGPNGDVLLSAHFLSGVAYEWGVTSSPISLNSPVALENRSRVSDHGVQVLDVQLADQGKLLLLRVVDGGDSIRIWDAATREERGAIEVERASGQPFIGEDGTTLLAGTELWDVRTARLLGSLPVDNASVTSFGADGKTVITLDDTAVRVWDIGALHALDVFQPDGLKFVESAKIGEDGRHVFVADASFDSENRHSSMRVWDLDAKKSLGPAIILPDVESSHLFHQARMTRNCERVVALQRAPVYCRIWDLATGLPLPATLPEVGLNPRGKLAPDGRTFFLYTDDPKGNSQLWNVDGTPAGTQFAIGRAFGFDLHPTENAILYVSDSRIFCRDSETGARSAFGPPEDSPLDIDTTIDSASFLPRGDLVLTRHKSSTETSSVRFWRLQSGASVGEPQTVTYESRMAFHPNGKQVAIGGRGDNPLRIWTIGSDDDGVLHVPRTAGLVNALEFNGAGDLLAVGTIDGVKLINSNTGAPHLDLPEIPSSESVHTISFNDEGDLIAFATSSGTVSVWSIPKKKPIWDPFPADSRLGYLGLEFTSDSLFIYQDQTFSCRSLETGSQVGNPLRAPEIVAVANGGPSFPHIRILDLGAKSGVLVGTHAVTVAKAWDSTSGEIVAGPCPSTLDATALEFDPEGGRVIIREIDGSIRLCDLATGKCDASSIAQLEFDENYWAEFSPDGSRFVSIRGDILQVWNAETSQPISQPIKGHQLAQRLGDTLVTRDDEGVVYVWSEKGGKLDSASRMDLRGPVYRSPDGRFLLWQVRRNEGRLCDGSSGEPVGPTFPLYGVEPAVFHSDGSVALVLEQDDTVRLLNLENCSPIGPPLVVDARVMDMKCSPDGNWAVIATDTATFYRLAMPTPLQGASEDIEAWAEFITGTEIDENSAIRDVKPAVWNEMKSRLEGAVDPFLQVTGESD